MDASDAVGRLGGPRLPPPRSSVTQDPARDRALALSNQHLDLILMPTEKCNFRCTYCYEDFAIGRMTDETIQGVVALLKGRLSALRSLNIGWFGGEPTLALDIVERINGSALAAKRDETHFASSISTNGWLLSTVNLRRLLAAEVRVMQISLDGDAEAHDQTRITRRGSGTFARIFGNIQDALATDESFRFALRLHVRRDNWGSIEALIDRVLDVFDRDPRVTLYVKALERLGGPNDAAIAVTEDHARLDRLKDRLKRLGVLESDAEPLICYAAKANSLIVRADGRIGKCTVALTDPRNTVGSIQPTGELLIDQERFRPWIRGLLSGDESSLRCPLADMG